MDSLIVRRQTTMTSRCRCGHICPDEVTYHVGVRGRTQRVVGDRNRFNTRLGAELVIRRIRGQGLANRPEVFFENLDQINRP